MITPRTGNDLAPLLQLAYDCGADFATVEELPHPYVLDRAARVVYLDGRLDLTEYFAALQEGLADLLGNVVALPVRRAGPGRRAPRPSAG